MQIIVTNEEAEVEILKAKAFCPIECSIGGKSIVDFLMMDHHGGLSHLESVAVRAYRDHFGVRRRSPRFVVVGVPDADATFAIASLAGILPHPDKDVSKVPTYLRSKHTVDWNGLADTIGIIDTDPIGRDILAMPGGDILLAWNALMAGAPHNREAAMMGVMLWKQLTSGNPAQIPLILAARLSEGTRRANAAKDEVHTIGRLGFVPESKVFGFDVWYGRDPEHAPDTPKGWKHPVVISRNAATDALTIGCPNKDVAEKVFGPGGLLNVFPKLDKAIAPGWGGREAIGGGPRGEKFTIEQGWSAAKVVAEIAVDDF